MMKTACVCYALCLGLASAATENLRGGGCAEPNGDCGENDDCHPKASRRPRPLPAPSAYPHHRNVCALATAVPMEVRQPHLQPGRRACADCVGSAPGRKHLPHLNAPPPRHAHVQVCEPICEPPKCSTRCQELGCSKCQIKCNKPECEVRCPVKHCEKGRCPECDTVCKDPLCHTECTNPQPVCESVCEEPVCDWKCHRPSNCPKPKCALVCEKSPHCQEQPPPPTDCCPCDGAAPADIKVEVATVMTAPNKCCGCAGAGAAPAGTVAVSTVAA